MSSRGGGATRPGGVTLATSVTRQLRDDGVGGQLQQKLSQTRQEQDRLNEMYRQASRDTQDVANRVWAELNNVSASPVFMSEVYAHPDVIAAQQRASAISTQAAAATRRVGELAQQETLARTQAQAEARQRAIAERIQSGRGALHLTRPGGLRALRAVFGADMRQATLEQIMGAHTGDTISISRRTSKATSLGDTSVSVTRKTAGGGIARYEFYRLGTVSAAREGLPRNALVMNVPYVRSATKNVASGRDLLRGLGELKGAGVARIHAVAARSDKMNGYDTWAKLGATGEIPSSLRPSAQQRFGYRITSVEQVMNEPGGPAWWKQHGNSFSATMDLLPGGRTRAILDQLSMRSAARSR